MGRSKNFCLVRGRGLHRVEYHPQSSWRASNTELKLINIILSLTLPPTRSHIFKNIFMIWLRLDSWGPWNLLRRSTAPEFCVGGLTLTAVLTDLCGTLGFCLCHHICASMLSKSSANGTYPWTAGWGTISGLEWGGWLTVFGRNDLLHTHVILLCPQSYLRTKDEFSKLPFIF